MLSVDWVGPTERTFRRGMLSWFRIYKQANGPSLAQSPKATKARMESSEALLLLLQKANSFREMQDLFD